MKVLFVFEIEMDCNTLEQASTEARSIRDTYFKPEAFPGLLIHTEGDDEVVSYMLGEDDKVTQL